MTTTAESSIFAPLSETTVTGEEWPTREDVFAPDSSRTETTEYSGESDSASEVEPESVGERNEFDETEPPYQPERFDEVDEVDEVEPEYSGEDIESTAEVEPEYQPEHLAGFGEVEPEFADEDHELDAPGPVAAGEETGYTEVEPEYEPERFDELGEIDEVEPEYADEDYELDEYEPVSAAEDYEYDEVEPEYQPESNAETVYEADYEFDSAPAGGIVESRQLAVQRLAMLGSHVGTAPDLILRWNRMQQPSAVDVVVHFHGFSGRGRAMNILTDKLPLSGLDFADPDNPSAVGRTTPTLLVLPRGHHDPSRNAAAYHFPALTKPGGLQQLIDEALQIFAAETGVSVRRNRLILTAHSGGGAAVMQVLGRTDPDEVHTFDALYADPAPLIDWARRHAASGNGALRVIYRANEGTAKNSQRVAQAISSSALPNFRVERTTVDHNHIPRRFGWRLLADASADLPGVSALKGSTPPPLPGPAPVPPPTPGPAPTPTADRAAGRVRRGTFAKCAKSEQPGARAMADQWKRLTGRKAGTFNCRSTYAGTPSLHGEGRSIDLYANANDPAQAAQADAYIAWMQQNAVELQVAYIIWNRRQWSWERRSQGWRPYGGGSPHTDHIHVDLSWEGALSPSPLFGGGVPGLGGSPSPTPVPVPDADRPCPHCAQQPTGAPCGSIARVAEEQFSRWHPTGGAALVETDPKATPILQDYYRSGVGMSVTAAQLQSKSFQAANPWSAVFISWVMRTAGAGSAFAYSRAHQVYIRAARQHRLADDKANPFHAFRATETAPQVGDLVCKSRNNSGATYDNIGDGRARATHCDVVVGVRPGQIRVIGGNVNQTVDARTLRTDADGKLSLDGAQSEYFAIVRCLGARAPQPQPSPTPRPSTGPGLTDAFFQELKAISARLGSDPGDLLAVMVSESNVDPKAQNPHGKATGLIQFMPQTLKGLGWTAGPDAFRTLTAEQQLPYVEKYYRPYRGQLTSAGRLYQATFLPATLKNSTEATVIAAPGGPNAKAYAANKGLDTNNDGVITVSDLTERLNRKKQTDRWKSLAARL